MCDKDLEIAQRQAQTAKENAEYGNVVLTNDPQMKGQDEPAKQILSWEERLRRRLGGGYQLEVEAALKAFDLIPPATRNQYRARVDPLWVEDALDRAARAR
jgi:hypothetical protein